MGLRIFLFLLFLFPDGIHAQVKFIGRAISEADHKRKAPLTEALNHGLAGISAEIKLNKNGHLVCGKHLFKETYLQPLHEIMIQNKGQIYPGKKVDFILYLHIGTDSIAIYKALRKTLEEFTADIKVPGSEEKSSGRIRIVLGGNIPYSLLEMEEKPLVMTAEQIKSDRPSPPVYLNAIDFASEYSWNGDKNMPNMQYHAFNTRVKAARKAGRKVIIHNYPDSYNAMEIILGTGADFLLVKDIPDFLKFWEDRKMY